MALVTIHRHVQGPFESDDDTWYNVCLVEDEDENVYIAEVNFETFEDALEAQETLTTTLYLLEAEVEGCSTTTLN